MRRRTGPHSWIATPVAVVCLVVGCTRTDPDDDDAAMDDDDALDDDSADDDTGDDDDSAGPQLRYLREADADLHGEFTGDAAGYAVSGRGDVNGDGYDDFLVADNNDPPSGRAYLFYGPPVSGNVSVADADVVFSGIDQSSTGAEVSRAGDVDGDGLNDFLITSMHDSSHIPLGGAVYLVRGSAGEGHRYLDEDADYKFLGGFAGGEAGKALSSGDFDGDGFSDLLISEYGSDSSPAAGDTFVIYGGPGL